MTEVVLNGPSHDNPFVDVELTATLTLGETESTVGGFYDRDGRWVFRYLPDATGICRFTTSSTTRSLNGVSGEFPVADAPDGAHGTGPRRRPPFAHADGTHHTPLGTTIVVRIERPRVGAAVSFMLPARCTVRLCTPRPLPWPALCTRSASVLPLSYERAV
ncbi:DUF5060 domain-containing protein [Nonomuraea sp. MTCD27]|uniref:DUF5060 domain-containing protein n=1 Tax=Nonomuraea sp. MTCD27 TaxID=1676747 RepID=UPI0035C08B8F